MRNLLTPLIELSDNDEFERRQADYERMLKSQQWSFVRDTYFTVRSRMLSDMLSLEYTNLDQTEKDVRQRAYYQIEQFLDFISNPTKWIRYKKRFRQPKGEANQT